MTKKLTVLTSDNRQLDNTHPPRALTKLSHVREELARVYRSARTGRLEISEATKLTFILATLAKIIEVSDLEQRIEKLEKKNDT